MGQGNEGLSLVYALQEQNGWPYPYMVKTLQKSSLELKGISIYTKPKSQRNSGLFCNFFTSCACIHQNVFKNIMPSYLSIAWNISFDCQSLEVEETTNFTEVGCL